MATYVDVYISMPRKGTYQLAPNPAVLKRDYTGLRFRNFTSTTLWVDLSSVPGFGGASVLQVQVKGIAVAEADPLEEKAGDWPYRIYLPELKPETVADGSPRVILDV
jgi:hypothetical protein